MVNTSLYNASSGYWIRILQLQENVFYNTTAILAIAGPDYECLYADIGSNGRMNDSGVWNNSDLRQRIENNDLSIPDPSPLPYGNVRIPLVFVGDDAFALKTYMMKPYPQKDLITEKRIYNYRHSRARRISENLFGILANRWRIFRSALNLSPDKATAITSCALVLHNFLRKSTSKSIYSPAGLADSTNTNGELMPGSWRTEQQNPLGVFSSSIQPQVGRNAPRSAKLVREAFTEYFMNEGSVEWQWEKA